MVMPGVYIMGFSYKHRTVPVEAIYVLLVIGPRIQITSRVLAVLLFYPLLLLVACFLQCFFGKT